MASQRRPLTVDDSEDDILELDLIDLTSEDETHASGLVDIPQSTTHQAGLSNNATQSHVHSRKPTSEIDRYTLSDGTRIRPGGFVELKCPQHRQAQAEPSGDFIRIKRILKNRLTGEVALEGHRFVREKYLVRKSFDGAHPRPDVTKEHPPNERKGPRLNELVMHLTVREDDDRPAIVQGLENIKMTQIKRKRKVILTDTWYPGFGFRDQAYLYRHLADHSKLEQRCYILENGPLVCRWSRTTIISPNGKAYGGIYKYFSKQDLAPPQLSHRSQGLRHTPSSQSHESAQRHNRAVSIEENNRPHVYRVKLPSKNRRYTYFDFYCGAGGASQGARQAGLKVLGGLDHDETAIQAWEKNNPGAIYLNMDSFDFLSNKNWEMIGRIDILNISNPCQPFSISHTTKGKNDETNINQLHVIKDLIEALKPRVVVLENTSGLANIEGNQKYFHKLLNDMSSAGSGYNLRYKIVNMADYGLPQERKRLIVIAAKKGLPLPPFPKPTHGPPGSGLKPYVSIGHALERLERLGHRLTPDKYYKVQKHVSPQERVYNPYTKFVDCLVTKGATCPHPSGEEFNPRQLAELQSLPPDFHLTGSWRQAIKQVGNMFPPLMAELIYRSCAQTLEAFDHGWINADEEIDDINVTLIEKGVDIPGSSLASASLIDGGDSVSASPYRYLRPPVLSDAVHVAPSSAWAKRKFGEDDSVDDDDEDEEVVSRKVKQKQRKVMTSTRERNS